MRRPGFAHPALPGLFALALFLAACAPAPDAADQAQAFWDAVAEDRPEDARALAVAGDATSQRRRLEELGVAGAEVERLAVPPEAEVALLPTRVERADIVVDDLPLVVETTTVLRRTDAGWRVDIDATIAEYRAASVEHVGEQLADAAGRLGDALGRGTGELGAVLERLGRDLGALIERETDVDSEALAAELGRRLEDAGEALTRGLEEMEQALREAEDARRREREERNREPDGDRSEEPRP